MGLNISIFSNVMCKELKPTDATDISPAMIDAGARVLCEQYGIVGDSLAEELAEEIFRVMLAKSRESETLPGHDMGPTA